MLLRYLASISCCLVFLYVNEVRAESIFLPPRYVDLYNKPVPALSSREFWRIKIHGLRMVALDPQVWAVRKIDRTENRHLVPIRPLFLRASEQDTFELHEISFIFRFKKESEKRMMKTPHIKDPVFDISFSGEFEAGGVGMLPKQDRSYVLRLSAFPAIPSGIFFRSHSRFVPVQNISPVRFETGRDYFVQLKTIGTEAYVFVDEKQLAQVSGRAFSKGFVSLTTAWHPIRMKNLKVDASLAGEKLQFAGIIPLPKARGDQHEVS